MPVKVIATGVPTPKKEITSASLENMIADFIENIAIARVNGSGTVVKKFGWYITRQEVLDLFDANTTETGDKPDLLEINFAVYSSDTVDVCDNTLSNMLTVVLKTTDKSKEPLPLQNQYVLIPGFDSAALPNKSGFSVAGVGCCPSYKP